MMLLNCLLEPRALIRHIDVVLPVRKYHCGNKTVARTSHLHYGNAYTTNMSSSY